ncbi:MAG: hypothetical protein M1823_005130 [Watsoniomyces obsoletus]|nr:MAG: hypothetical protein M1823_005130 [Watsoniomyces obsoletus]
MPNPSQLFLLADHIKLSLLERQRAISLNLEPNSQDGHISRSLESLREGLKGINEERQRLENNGDESSATTLTEQASILQTQLDDLTSQFRGFSPPTPSTTHPNDPSLSSTFTHAQSSERPRIPSQSSFANKRRGASPHIPKSVRFRDSNPNPNGRSKPPPDNEDEDNDPSRAGLFPYRDDPTDQVTTSAEGSNNEELNNTQIHTYHEQVLQDQDDQLDRLGESIGRQRELSIQIGDELDTHVQLLDDVDVHVERHQTRLDGARKRLGHVARRAKDNVQLSVIAILIVVLVVLVLVLKT